MVLKAILLTAVSMVAFAANSLLCRMALSQTNIDAASFSSIRLLSGAVILCSIVIVRDKRLSMQGNWISALALFTYVAGFSFAYLNLATGTGGPIAIWVSASLHDLYKLIPW